VSLERGRAVFHVAKDSARPFLVISNGTVVRAVGTIFGVEQRQQGVVVTVSEGKVVVLTPQLQQRGAAGKRGSTDVTSASATGNRLVADRVQQGVTGRAPIDQPSSTESDEAGAGVFVTAGEQLKVGSSGDADAVRAVNVKQALSWAEGYLVFDSTPLSDVVAEFNHYNNVQLRLGDTELSRRPISGTFLVSDLETLIAFIEAGAHVSVTREERGNTVLITLLP
jgi:transmembrane sensor